MGNRCSAWDNLRSRDGGADPESGNWRGMKGGRKGGVAKETSMYDGKRGSPMGQHESRQSV